MPGTTYFNDEVTNYPYNPEKAKELLAEAGYPDGFDTTMAIYATAGTSVQTVEALTEQLAKVGIRATIDLSDLAAYVVKIDGWGKGMIFHAMTLANGAPSIIFMNFRQGLNSGLGVASFDIQDDLDALVNKAVSSTGEESEEYFRQAQKMIFEDYCLVKYMGCVFSTTARSSNVHDSTIGEVALGVPTTWNLHKAWVSK